MPNVSSWGIVARRTSRGCAAPLYFPKPPFPRASPQGPLRLQPHPSYAACPGRALSRAAWLWLAAAACWSRSYRRERGGGGACGWVAARKCRLNFLYIDRTLAVAQRVVHQVVQVLALGCVPLFLTDGFTEYRHGTADPLWPVGPAARRQATGPLPKPRWMPLPQLRYAQVIKTVRRRRLVWVTQRVVFGTLAAIEQVLAAQGWQLQTACIERVTLTLRQHVAAIGRRVLTLCKSEEGLRQQLAL